MDINAAVADMLKEYDRDVKNNTTIKAIAARIDKKKSSYPEVTRLASLSGSIAGDIAVRKIESIYSGERFTETDVRSLISPLLRRNYDFVAGYIEKVQNAQNEKAGIGLKAIIPKYDADRENGIIKEIIDWSIENEVTWQHQSAYREYVRTHG